MRCADAPPSQRQASLLARAAAVTLACAVFSSAVHAQPAPAHRIVSLAPHLTELAFAAGAGDSIVGTVEYSDYPEGAQRIARIGDAFRVDLERVLALKPDVVLAWTSGTPVQTIERLRALGLTVRSIATSQLADVSLALLAIGEIAGAETTAASAAARFDERIAALREQHRGRAQVSVFVQVGDRPLYTINGRQIISEALELCGGRNVFAELNDLAPVVSMEAVIAANPQVILATDYAVADAPAYWRRWEHIAAVRTGAVYTISSDKVSRATPRLADGVDEVCRTLDAARVRMAAQR